VVELLDTVRRTAGIQVSGPGTSYHGGVRPPRATRLDLCLSAFVPARAFATTRVHTTNTTSSPALSFGVFLLPTLPPSQASHSLAHRMMPRCLRRECEGRYAQHHNRHPHDRQAAVLDPEVTDFMTLTSICSSPFAPPVHSLYF